MKYYLSLIFAIISILGFAPTNFKAVLLCKQDSTPMPFAIVKSLDMGTYAETNINGEFKFQFPPKLNKYRLEIFAIGLRDTIIVKRSKNQVEKIYINKPLLDLSLTTVKGLRAKDAVQKAVEMIPLNYTDSSFASFSFYRQYEKVNGTFKNLIEAKVVILFKLISSKKIITSGLAFAIEQMRRSSFKYDIEDFNFYKDDLKLLLEENPVYNLVNSSLNPNALNFYTFNYDTTNKTDDFVIKYTCDRFSSEGHGVENIRELNWYSEGREAGSFIIDSKSFAFKKIERTSFRNKAFNYPRNNNFILPSRHYYGEFVDGNLIIEYEQVKDKWFPKTIMHKYTNDYFKSGTLKKEYTITEFFEWHSDSVSHFIKGNLADRFYTDSPLQSKSYSYDKTKWNESLFPFYFYGKDEVYKDLEKQSSIEEQFINGGK